jgi:hypothetical protein
MERIRVEVERVMAAHGLQHSRVERSREAHRIDT